MRYLLIVLAILILDQSSKWVIANYMEIGDAIPVIGEFFQIVSHRNKGAAFGILQGQRWFFLIVTVVVLIGLAWYLRKSVVEGKKLLCCSLALIMGGALGNFIDRALHGEVVDFLRFHFGFINYTFAIFNVADSAIVIGVGLLLLDTILEWHREKRGRINESQEPSET